MAWHYLMGGSMTDRDSAYWAADRAAFEAAMEGEELDFTPWGLLGIENAYKADKTRLMYFGWTQGREFESAAGVRGTYKDVTKEGRDAR